MKLKMLLALSALALTACDKSVELVNGQLPAELVAPAQKLAGSYEGRFNGVPNTLTVAVEGDRLTLTPAADLVGSRCASRVGNAMRVLVSGKNEQVNLRGASFAFDPGACPSTEGRRLHVEMSTGRDGVQHVDVRLLVGTREHVRFIPGEVRCGTDRHGRTFCWQTPGRYERWLEPEFAFGRFSKR